MTNWVNNIGNWGLGLVALIAGLIMVIAGIIGIAGALSGKEKDWKKAAENIGIALLGGLIGWWGASSILSFFKSKGQEIPHS